MRRCSMLNYARASTYRTMLNGSSERNSCVVCLGGRTGIDVQENLSLLPSAEQQQARQFRFEKDRVTYVLGRYMLRTLLARTLHLRPQAIEFAYNKYGKPTRGAQGAPGESSGTSEVSTAVKLTLSPDPSAFK
jgi:hypothetical protein